MQVSRQASTRKAFSRSHALEGLVHIRTTQPPPVANTFPKSVTYILKNLVPVGNNVCIEKVDSDLRGHQRGLLPPAQQPAQFLTPFVIKLESCGLVFHLS